MAVCSCLQCNSRLFFLPVLSGHCGVKSSSPLLVVCLYRWARPLHRGKPSPSLQLTPQLTAALLGKAAQRQMLLCSPAWMSRAWDSVHSPQLTLVWMDSQVSCKKYDLSCLSWIDLMLSGCAAVPQGGGSALITVQVSTVIPAHQNPTPPSPMDTSAKTALFTLRRLTPSSHSRRHRHLSWCSLPLTFCPHRHRRLSQVCTPETEVEGTRLVRNCPAALLCVGLILPDASKQYAVVTVRVWSWLSLSQVSWGQCAAHVSVTANRAWHLCCLWSPSSSAVCSGLLHRPGPLLEEVNKETLPSHALCFTGNTLQEKR